MIDNIADEHPADSSAGLAVRCPVCDASCPGVPLCRYTATEVATHFCPPSRSRDRHARLERCIKRLWRGDECFVLRCRGCGFAFGHPFVGGDDEFYGILHEQAGYPGWRWDYDVAISKVLTGRRGGRVLDVGAGAGGFLRGLDRRWECYAMEGSETTRKLLQDAGITVFRDLHDVADSYSGTFQVVTLFQVLEHIAEFRALLFECRRLLADDGQIVITVPDCDAMLRQPTLTGEHDMPPNHINKWTPGSLQRVLREMYLDPREAIYEPASWRKAAASLCGRVRSDAARPRSLAAQAYRVRDKRIRAPLLAMLGLLAGIRLAPDLLAIRQGGAFAMIATAVPVSR